jgi:hypothetical protein
MKAHDPGTELHQVEAGIGGVERIVGPFDRAQPAGAGEVSLVVLEIGAEPSRPELLEEANHM